LSLFNDYDILVYNGTWRKATTIKLKARATVNENGRVVIPASFRKRLGIRAGDELLLQLEDDELRITTLQRNLDRARRLVRKHVESGTSLVDELIAERRESVRRE
jgi:AbrB family looped-hinge helix DNA binding protein